MAEKPIRVLRLLEYTYPDVRRMEQDQANWAIPGGSVWFGQTLIRSTTLPLTVLDQAETASPPAEAEKPDAAE